MPKVLLYFLGAISLIGLIAGGIYKIYDLGGDAREDKLRLEFSQTEAGRLQEIVKLQEGAREALKLTEAQIRKDRIVYRDREKIIEKIIDNCADRSMPADALVVLEADGVYQRQD